MLQLRTSWAHAAELHSIKKKEARTSSDYGQNEWGARLVRITTRVPGGLVFRSPGQRSVGRHVRNRPNISTLSKKKREKSKSTFDSLHPQANWRKRHRDTILSIVRTRRSPATADLAMKAETEGYHSVTDYKQTSQEHGGSHGKDLEAYWSPSKESRLVSLQFSPHVFVFHFCILFLPQFCIACKIKIPNEINFSRCGGC